jgi:hypothetical protein
MYLLSIKKPADVGSIAGWFLKKEQLMENR